MPEFRLELTVPRAVPEDRATTTFYWSSNASNSFETMYGPNLGRLGPVTHPNVDFVRIAAAAFTADRSTPRKNRDSNWNSRDIGLTVPVHSPDRWRAVGDNLASLLGMLTGDSWGLEFVPSYGPGEPVAQFTPGAERVVLVSGGADSAIGAVRSRQTVGTGGHVLVSHIGATVLAPVQRSVASGAARLVPGVSQAHRQIRFSRKARQVNGAAFPTEPSSRSRSLLFLAFGLAVASREGIPLWIPENGFASLNPPLGAERRGSLSTRTTHPAFLEGLSSILDQVGAQSTIVNPFSGQTKGQMFADLAEEFGKAEASTFLSRTHSCGATGQRAFGVSLLTQCGVCFGCVVRKASFHASGIPDRTDYIISATGTRLEGWLRRNSIESSVRASLQRGIRSHDIAAMGLPPGYSSRDALDLCERGLTELRGMYP